ncbi:DUF1242-domain-containing protein [Xylariaceae sp. AK1471]|nr:DUF1242-domain-containing protein [Xylariaceae sp. AK1471]
MSALFNFQSLLLVILLLICTSAYVHNLFPTILDRNKQGFLGIFWKAARIGERLSPYISLCCVFMAVRRALSQWLSAPDPSPSRLISTAGKEGRQRSSGRLSLDKEHLWTTTRRGDGSVGFLRTSRMVVTHVSLGVVCRFLQPRNTLTYCD